MIPALPLAHHFIQALPVVMPALVLPVGLVVWTLRDRCRADAGEQDAQESEAVAAGRADRASRARSVGWGRR